MDMAVNPKIYVSRYMEKFGRCVFERPYLILPFISMILIYPISLEKPMPLWSDTGEWLKYAKAYEAVILKALGFSNGFIDSVDRVMGNLSPFGYPPLSLLAISIFRSLLGDILGVHLYGVLTLSLLPVVMYFLAYEFTGSRNASLYTGLATLFAPIYQEIFAWGGYPNLTGLIFMALSIKYLYRYIIRGRGIYKSALFGILTVFTHHLTTAVFIGVLGIWMFLLALFREYKGALNILYIFSIVSAAFILYRYGYSYLADYNWFNEAAFYDLRVSLVDAFIYAYKTNLLAIVVTVTGLYLLFDLLDDSIIFSLMFGWIATPLLLSQSYVVGVSIDYARFIFFLAQPVALILGIGVTRVRFSHWMEVIAHYRRRIGSITLSILLITSLLATIQAGVSTPYEISRWYNVVDEYNVWSRYDALQWINNETLLDDVFVAEEVMGRWIEGYTLRDTYIALHPRWAFRAGQDTEYYLASTILYSATSILTPHYRLLIQGSLNPRWSYTLEVFYRGAYRELLTTPISDIVSYDHLTGEQTLLTPLYNGSRGDVASKQVYWFKEGWVSTELDDVSIDGFTLYIEWDLEVNTSYIGFPLLAWGEYRGFRLSGDEIIFLLGGASVTISVYGAVEVFELPWEPGKILLISDGKLVLRFRIESPRSGYVDGVEIIYTPDLVDDLGVDYIVAPGKSIGDRGDRRYFLRLLYDLAYYNGGVAIYSAR